MIYLITLFACYNNFAIDSKLIFQSQKYVIYQTSDIKY